MTPLVPVSATRKVVLGLAFFVLFVLAWLDLRETRESVEFEDDVDESVVVSS